MHHVDVLRAGVQAQQHVHMGNVPTDGQVQNGVYAYVHVCVYTCTYVYTQVPKDGQVQNGVYAFVYVYVYTCTYVYTSREMAKSKTV